VVLVVVVVKTSRELWALDMETKGKEEAAVK